MRTRRILIVLVVAVAAAFAFPASSPAHTLLDNGTVFPANNNSVGCFRPHMEFGEGGGGKIHMNVYVNYQSKACGQTGFWATGTTGAGLLMLMKYTGSGPYGGWKICDSWVAVHDPNAPIVQVEKHVDSPLTCGGGTYAAGFCAGPSGYSSIYWPGHSTYTRNCAGNYVNWSFSEAPHDFF